MVFEKIERLKREYTDKYVVVDDSRPELKRFRGQTGVIKTVNMSGKALVEFDAYANIGWYDIDFAFLKVVDRPLTKEPRVTTAPSEAKTAAGVSTEKAKPAPAKLNTADILAAARGKGGSPAPSATDKVKGAAKLSATAKTASPAKATEKTPAKKSVEEVLAAARAGKTPSVSAETKKAEAEEAHDQVPAEPAAKVSAPSSAAATATPEKLPKDTAAIVAYCRSHDGKS
jgi:hypothetical protein